VARGAASRVDDAAPCVSSLQAQRQVASALQVEDDAPLAQVAYRRRRLVDQDLDGRGAAETAPGGNRVGRVAGGGVAWLEGRSQAALRPEARAL